MCPSGLTGCSWSSPSWACRWRLPSASFASFLVEEHTGHDSDYRHRDAGSLCPAGGSWNLLPLTLAWLAVRRGTNEGPTRWGGLAFAGVTTFAIALMHAAWVFDWGGTRTGSFTAGLVFLFSPACAIILGTCAWAVAKLEGRLAGDRTAAQQGAVADAANGAAERGRWASQ